MHYPIAHGRIGSWGLKPPGAQPIHLFGMGTAFDNSRGLSRVVIERARSGDNAARDHIMRAMMPMAERVARRFAGPQHPADDLQQMAGIGLLKAIERFDPSHDAAFATYAHALMTG